MRLLTLMIGKRDEKSCNKFVISEYEENKIMENIKLGFFEEAQEPETNDSFFLNPVKKDSNLWKDLVDHRRFSSMNSVSEVTNVWTVEFNLDPKKFNNTAWFVYLLETHTLKME